MHQLLHHCVCFKCTHLRRKKETELSPVTEQYLTCSSSQFNHLLRRTDQSEKTQKPLEIILSSLVAQSRLKQRRLSRAVSSWVFSISKMETPLTAWATLNNLHSKTIFFLFLYGISCISIFVHCLLSFQSVSETSHPKSI